MTESQIINSIAFYGFALITIIFAIAAIMSYKIVYTLLLATIAFFSISGIFFILGADYNAVVQVSIFGFAIPILFAFAIMFTDYKSEVGKKFNIPWRFIFAFFAIAVLITAIIYLFVIVIYINPDFNWILIKQKTLINKYQLFTALAQSLYVNHVIAFELVSILLPITIVGLSTFNIIKRKYRG